MRNVLYLWLVTVFCFSICCGICCFTMDTMYQEHIYFEQENVLHHAIATLDACDTQDAYQTAMQQLCGGTKALETTKDCFVMVYDQTNGLIYSNATYENETAIAPLGLVITHDDAIMKSQWTPDETLRFATCASSFHDGHVIIGKTMEAYQENIDHFTQQLTYFYGAGCLFSLMMIFVLHKAFHHS